MLVRNSDIWLKEQINIWCIYLMLLLVKNKIHYLGLK